MRPAPPRVRGWWICPALALGALAAPWPAWLVEAWYSRRLFPIIQGATTRASNLTTLAVVDLALAAALAWLVWLGWRTVRIGGRCGWGSAVWESLRRLLRLLGVLVLGFVLAWGLNYRRVPLELTLGGTAGDTATIVRALAIEAAAGAAATREAGLRAPTGFVEIATRLGAPFQEALRRLDLAPLAVVGRPKHSRVLTPFFTAAGVTGMVNPLVLESIVHPDLLPFERAMVLAHEWAHLAGLADEADASAVAWLACRLGDDGLQYSAHLSLLMEAAGAMPRGDWLALRADLDPGVVEDIRALSRRIARQQPVVRDAAFRVYDGYLRSNRVDDGVRSYSRVLRVVATPGMQRALALSAGRGDPDRRP